MERDPFARYLEPPPRLVAPAEALPHLGGLSLARYQGEMPDEMEFHPVEPLEGAFDDAAAQAILKRVSEMPAVRERLSQRTSKIIGVSRRGEREKGEALTHVLVAYDYAADVAVEISLDEQGQLFISDRHYQPPPSQSEIERAIDLARRDERLATKVDGLVATAIPFSGLNNEFAYRRVLEVLFGCRSDRLPKYRAWVDLSRESVLHAGSACECCDDEEVRS